MARRAHKRRAILQRYDAFLGPGFEFRPFARMLFRPKEIHAASGKRQIVPPLSIRNVEVETKAFRLFTLDYTVAHSHMLHLAAAEARRFDFDGFARKQP
jgi:hypothetical protein